MAETQQRRTRASAFALGRPDPQKQVQSLAVGLDELEDDNDINQVLGAYTSTIQAGVEEALKQVADKGDPSSSFSSDFSRNEMVFRGAGDLQALVDQTEGAGDYNTLFGFAQDKDTPFNGVDVSTMTIGELETFTDPDGEYGQWVKARNKGVVGTPLGRYQIVGSTLKDVASDLGFDKDTVFTPEVQDQMFAYLVSRRLKNAKTDKQMLTQLRNEWHGFKSVDDDTLLAAAKQFSFSKQPKPRPQGLGAKES